jgi:glycosidase
VRSDHSFRDLCVRFLATDQIDGIEAAAGLARLWAQYPWPVTLVNHNLVGSHDVARFLTVAGDEPWRLRLACFLQLTFPGAPGLYYGDEIEMAGLNDPGSRRTFDWASKPTKHPTYRMIAELTALRRRNPVLATGEWRPLVSTTDVLAFTRGRGTNRLGVFLNRGGRTGLRMTGLQKVLFGGAKIGGETLRLPARSGAVVKIGAKASVLSTGGRRPR